MATLIVDDLGRPIPQYQNKSTSIMEACKGISGGMDTNIINEALVKAAPIANQTDALKVQQTGALPAGTNKLGTIGIIDPLPVGNNKIGSVEIEMALPAGTNTIGKVEITTLPALPTGNNNIGNVDLNIPQFIPLKVTLVAGVAYEVKATAGYVSKIQSTLTDIVLRNNATEVWGSISNIDFHTPVYLNSKILLISATGGTAYISYI